MGKRYPQEDILEFSRGPTNRDFWTILSSSSLSVLVEKPSRFVHLERIRLLGRRSSARYCCAQRSLLSCCAGMNPRTVGVSLFSRFSRFSRRMKKEARRGTAVQWGPFYLWKKPDIFYPLQNCKWKFTLFYPTTDQMVTRTIRKCLKLILRKFWKLYQKYL